MLINWGGHKTKWMCRKLKIFNWTELTSAKQELPFEEVFDLCIVVFCVCSEPCACTSWLCPVNLCHSSHEHPQGTHLHVTFQLQDALPGHLLTRVIDSPVFREHYVETLHFPHDLVSGKTCYTIPGIQTDGNMPHESDKNCIGLVFVD